ncbi:RusA family crossover junction endodeoxyribonuclease [Oceanobacillus profundus]|nr:RusA family crossover junction endodeoxyribonuclease [Oceanobacillus profundus]
MREELRLPMMMFGSFKQTKAKRDENNKTIKKPNGQYVLQKYTKVHNEMAGDPGVFPSVNHIYQRTKNGRQKLTKPAENLLEKWNSLAQIWSYNNGWELRSDKVVVEITTYFPNDNKERDTHNAIKLMMDALEGVIYKKDSKALPRIMDFHKVEDNDAPHFMLTIYKKEEEYEIMQSRYREAS